MRDPAGAAWLALVKELHPDRNPDPEAARRLAEINGARTAGRSERRDADDPPGNETAAADDTPGNETAAADDTPGNDAMAGAAWFAVDAFRPAAFEGVLVAAADVGDVTDTDEPFSLDIRVDRAFCHVELAPEAGGSVITVECDEADAVSVAATLAAAMEALGFTVG